MGGAGGQFKARQNFQPGINSFTLTVMSPWKRVGVAYLYVLVWSSHRPQRMEPTIPATTSVKPIRPAFSSWFYGEEIDDDALS